jgi:cellulose synthase/poly-beta-1,6-N-acetylglucosamine synthase-like glycosyltransferase
MMKVIEILFVVSAIVVFYTYLGYGMIIYLMVKIKELFFRKSPVEFVDGWPRVTLLIAAYNEEEIIEQKMLNTNSLLYPSDRLDIVWVTDGSTDATNDLLGLYSNVKVLYEPQRKGKTAALNRAVPLVETPFVVFTDANTMLNEKAINNIIAPFADPLTGCVAGEKRVGVSEKSSASAGGEGLYWRYESFLKDMDARLCTAVGAAGELFAIRTELFEPMPEDTLLDDFMLSMKIASRGYRIEYCKDAYAVEDGSANMAEEKKRKVRIAAGGIQSVRRLFHLLNPFRYGMLSFQYISHRVLRWTLTPVLLFLLFPLNIMLAFFSQGAIYDYLLAAQLLFYGLALSGRITRERETSNKLLFVTYYFLFMNWNVFHGFRYLARKSKGDGTWEKAKRA